MGLGGTIMTEKRKQAAERQAVLQAHVSPPHLLQVLFCRSLTCSSSCHALSLTWRARECKALTFTLPPDFANPHRHHNSHTSPHPFPQISHLQQQVPRFELELEGKNRRQLPPLPCP